jgi:hypothetical protein
MFVLPNTSNTMYKRKLVTHIHYILIYVLLITKCNSLCKIKKNTTNKMCVQF